MELELWGFVAISIFLLRKTQVQDSGSPNSHVHVSADSLTGMWMASKRVGYRLILTINESYILIFFLTFLSRSSL